jgi:hypothetical protein
VRNITLERRLGEFVLHLDGLIQRPDAKQLFCRLSARVERTLRIVGDLTCNRLRIKKNCAIGQPKFQLNLLAFLVRDCLTSVRVIGHASRTNIV